MISIHPAWRPDQLKSLSSKCSSYRRSSPLLFRGILAIPLCSQDPSPLFFLLLFVVEAPHHTLSAAAVTVQGQTDQWRRLCCVAHHHHYNLDLLQVLCMRELDVTILKRPHIPKNNFCRTRDPSLPFFICENHHTYQEHVPS